MKISLQVTILNDIICTVIWFQVLLSNTNNLYTIICFQVTKNNNPMLIYTTSSTILNTDILSTVL